MTIKSNIEYLKLNHMANENNDTKLIRLKRERQNLINQRKKLIDQRNQLDNEIAQLTIAIEKLSKETKS